MGRARRTSIRPGGFRLVVAGALVAGLVSGVPGPAQAVALPEGFQEDVVLSGLTDPVAVRFPTDGRVFVAEKSGLIKVFDDLTDSTATTFADLRTNVHNFWDRGLLGMALAPGFPSDPYVYVSYAFDFDPSIPADFPRWGMPAESSDPCPSPPGPTGNGCVVTGRVSRLRADGNVMTGSEEVLIEDWCQQYPSHSMGSLAFGPDGALYVGAGEGASFTRVDYGQDGEPPNPCGDPPAGSGGTQTPPTAEGGALRSQDLRTPGDPTSLHGAILRVDPATGAALPDNPGTGDANARRIVASGFRNPFRFTLRPGTDELWVGDPGWLAWEEIVRVPDPQVAPVENAGWPCYEGPVRQPGYDGADLTLCEELYAAGAGAVLAPQFAYSHDAEVVAGESCPTGSSAIAGLAFYQGGSYPPAYDGALFFADYSRGCIWAMYPGADGIPDPGDVSTFLTGAANPVDLQIGPGGDLFYVDFGGTIRRISFADDNQAPAAVATADPTTGPAPLTVSFDGTGSSDPDPGDSITYAWDLDGDGEYDDATGTQPTRTYDPGTYTVRLRVTDGHGATSTSAPITIASDNTPPTVTIDTPGAGTSWGAGDTIVFSGHATDPQQGTLPASALSWSVTMQHCPSSCHQHPLQTFAATSGGSFGAPDHEYPSHLELSVTATDAGGLTDSETLRLDPRTAELRFTSTPIPGVTLGLDASTAQTPFTRTVIERSRHSIFAPESVAGGPGYWFDSWSDGGARAHDITADAGGGDYRAIFRPDQEPTAVADAEPTSGPAPLVVQFDATGSFDPDPPDSIVSYVWDLDGDGQYDDSSSPDPSWTYGVGTHSVGLRVTDELGSTDTDVLTVTAVNNAPAVTIDTPPAGTTWRVGELIPFSGHATDAQDGALTGSALAWTVHLCDPGSCAKLHVTSGARGSFTAPEATYPSWIEVRLTATDSDGLAERATLPIDPRTVRLTFRSAPIDGVRLAMDGQHRRSRFSEEVIVGSHHSIRAPARVRRGGRVRVFARWSDGGARGHTIVAGEANRVYLAMYRGTREPPSMSTAGPIRSIGASGRP